jgi:ankyrin repeat protein
MNKVNRKFIEAIKTLNYEQTKNLIKKGANVNLIMDEHEGLFPLMNIVMYGFIGDIDPTKFIDLLLENGANINLTSNDRITVLHFACMINNYRVTKILIERGKKFKININPKCKQGLTPLLIATTKNNYFLIKYLLDNGSDPNLSDDNKNTPLMVACENSELGEFMFCTPKDKEDLKKIMYNRVINKPEITDLTIKEEYEQIYYERNNNRTGIKGVVTQCANMHIVELLINNGANLNSQNAYGFTPLMRAVEEYNIILVEYLINKKVNLELKDLNGFTVLRRAINNPEIENCFCQFQKLKIIELLIKSGTNVNSQDNKGFTSLTEILYEHNKNNHNNNEIAKLLIKYGADVNLQSIYGTTPLKIAVENDNIEMVKILINNGANIFVKTLLDENLLKFTKNEIIKNLLKKYGLIENINPT